MSKAEFEHASYGMVSIARVSTSGKRRFFGSPSSTHYSSVLLRIHGCVRVSDITERYFPKNSLIEVELTEMQFAALLTNLNQSGVPCTIRSQNGSGVEGPPQTPMEADLIQEDFGEDLKDLAATVVKVRDKVKALLSNKNLTKADKEGIMRALDDVVARVESSLPYTLERFYSATERMVATARAEVDAFVGNALRAAGLDALTSASKIKLFANNSDDVDPEP